MDTTDVLKSTTEQSPTGISVLLTCTMAVADNPVPGEQWSLAACPDRTTAEWLHQAGRDDGALRTSNEDMYERSNPEHRLNAVFEHGHSIVVLYLDDSDHVEHTASR